MLNHFSNLSCYEEFEIRCALTCISKVDVLKAICYKIDDYYFFISDDGIFNWFDLEGTHVDDPGILKELKWKHIPIGITKCIIPDSVTSIGYWAFKNCNSLTSIAIPNSVTNIGAEAFCFCKSLTSITIPDSVTHIGKGAFFACKSLKEVVFKRKTLDEVKQMRNYPFEIEDKNVFKFS